MSEKTEKRRAGVAQRGGPPWLAAGMGNEKADQFWPSVTRLLGRMRPYRLGLLLVLGLGVSSVALSVYIPKLMGHATDIIFSGVVGRNLPAGVTKDQAVAGLRQTGHGNVADMVARMHVVPGAGIDFIALGRIVIIGIVLFALSALLQWLQNYLLAGLVQKAMYDLRAEIEAKLHRLPLPYVDSQPRGDLLSRATNDIDNVAQTLQQALGQLLVSLLTVLGVIVLMFVISPLLAVIAILTVPLSMVITQLIAKRSQRLFAAQWAHTGTLNAHIEETFTGHEVVKVYGHRRGSEAAFDDHNDDLFRASFGAQFVSGIIMPAMLFIGNLGYVGVAVVGGLRVAAGAMTLGDVQAFIQYSRQFSQPVGQLASMANVLQSGAASAERVFELLDAPEQQPDPAAGEPGGPVRGRIEFRDVSFRYQPDVPLIEDLSFVAEPGQTVAIVGPTGAGKTTVVNLVMRFYELDHGQILLDGVDLTRMPRDDLRGKIGMVLQDTWLFGGTIRENILYGRPEATEEEFLTAARAAYVDRFVHGLPHGYETVIDDEGGTLSAGERQLVTIARAFLVAPSLLILDEATSAVDTRTEVLVQRAMANLRSNRTSFVIAHRLSTIRDADLILVMIDGQIVERGTHEELISAGGTYRNLHDLQFRLGVADEAVDVPVA